jgi:glutamyl-tRNA reductase
LIVCLSASHKTATLSMLEKLNISETHHFSHELLDGGLLQELAVLQTCHRVEFFFACPDSRNSIAARQVLKLWSTQTGVSLDIIEKTVQVFQGQEALQHLFYLAAGLESVILGEDQVLGQVRTSWHNARSIGTTGMILDRAFMKAISIGRKVRNETKINEGAVSISSAAVDLAEKELGDLAARKALVIGAGEAGTLAALALKEKAVSNIKVANRTYAKGLLLADRISGDAIHFEDIKSTIPEMDIVVTAVSVIQPLLREDTFHHIFGNSDESKRLLLIDISQPRAVEEKIGSLPGVSLKTIDDLKQLVGINLRNRAIEAEKSKAIINNELSYFEIEQSKRVIEPLISNIFRNFETIREKELSRAIRKMKETDRKKLLILERFSKELVERIAQIPIEQLRVAALANDDQLISVAQKIFRTQDSPNK